MTINKNLKICAFGLCFASQIFFCDALFNSDVFAKEYNEHNSWGARINPIDKSVSFKFFTFPDAKKVYVIVKNQDGDKDFQAYKLKNMGKGIFQKKGISPKLIKEGDKYKFLIVKNDNTYSLVKDPYSFKQEELTGPSTIYDHSKYKWKNDKKWKSNHNRISRIADKKNGYKTIREARIYELNPDSFTEYSSYEGIKTKIKRIKNLGFNTVEIMHIENTYSYNWGYDGVDKHAPSQYLGGPDKLKELVDFIHGEGLNVVFDVVPNHHGPDGNQLRQSGPYINGRTPWGDAYNYDGNDHEYVRDYIINAFLNWAENYHIDGFRLDMTKAMKSDYTIKQIAAEMNYHHPDVFIIAEDARGGVKIDDFGHYWKDLSEIHDKRVVNPLKDEEYGKGLSQKEHAKKIQEIIKYNTNLVNLGMDSEWDFYFYHKMNDAMQDTTTYSPELKSAILCAQDNVKYVDSHDEVGNRNGTRKIVAIMCKKLALKDNIELNRKDIKRVKQLYKQESKKQDSDKTIKTLQDAYDEVTLQKAEFACEALAIYFQTGKLNKYRIAPKMNPKEEKKLRTRFRKEILNPLGIKKDCSLSVKNIETVFIEACNQYKMALAMLFGVPGPKMVFQGCEDLDLTPFRFFRKFKTEVCEDNPYLEEEYTREEKYIISSVLKENKKDLIKQNKKLNLPALIKKAAKKIKKTALFTINSFKEDNINLCENKRYIQCGYKQGQDALNVSTLGKIDYSERAEKIMTGSYNLVKDLNKINEENSALKFGYIDPFTTIEYRQTGIIGFNSIYKENEIFVLANFGKNECKKDANNACYIKFPYGKWVEIMNTDDKKYGGGGQHMNTGAIISNGDLGAPINLAQYSTAYFKRVK